MDPRTQASEELPTLKAIAIAGHSPLLAGAIAFAAAMATGAVYDEYSRMGLTPVVWFLIAAAVSLAFMTVWDLSNLFKDVAFLRFLYRTRRSIRESGAPLGPVNITPETRLYRYRAYLGLIAFGLSRQSRYRPDRSVVDHVSSSLVTLICGWWVIPWGPMQTVGAVLENTKAPVVYTVHELLAAMEYSP